MLTQDDRQSKTVICPTCDGYGEVRHPNWGSRTCPEPTIECPQCFGEGVVF
jgi:DnaJ-class molecular chaperone